MMYKTKGISYILQNNLGGIARGDGQESSKGCCGLPTVSVGIMKVAYKKFYTVGIIRDGLMR